MFSERLKNLRKNKGLLQQDMADKIGVTKSAYGYYEQGKTTPDIVTAKKIAEILNVSIDYLLGESDYKKTKSVRIPVLGTVQAGIPIEAVQDILDYEEIEPEMVAHGDEYFALRVKGSSMEPRMREGDVVIVRKQSDVNHDDTAIVLVNGNEATIKRVLKSEAGIMLAPNNPAFEPKFYSNKDIKELPVVILGKVVELRAKF